MKTEAGQVPHPQGELLSLLGQAGQDLRTASELNDANLSAMFSMRSLAASVLYLAETVAALQHEQAKEDAQDEAEQEVAEKFCLSCRYPDRPCAGCGKEFS